MDGDTCQHVPSLLSQLAGPCAAAESAVFVVNACCTSVKYTTSRTQCREDSPLRPTRQCCCDLTECLPASVSAAYSRLRWAPAARTGPFLHVSVGCIISDAAADAFGSSSCILPFLSPCHSRIQSLLSCMRLDLPVRARICTRRANARIRTGGGPWMYFTITNEPRGTRTKPRHACARSPAIHRCHCLHPHSEWFVFIQTNLNGCGRWKSSHNS